MKKGSLLAIIAGAIGLIALFAVLPNMLRPADGQAQPSAQSAASGAVPRLQGTQQPNLSGVWQALNEANWDLEPHAMKTAWTTHPGVPSGGPVPNAPVLAWGATAAVPGSIGVVVGGEIPYKPEALQKRNDNLAHAIERDPEVKCLLPGVPRATYLPVPFQITQSHTKIMMQYGFSNAGRTIHLDEVDDPGIESWMGHSVGKWEGDALVVNVSNLNGDTWFDRAGNHHSAEMKVTERYTPVDASHIMYEATIDAWRIGRGRRVGREARDEVIPISLRDLAPLLGALPDPALLIGPDGRIAGSNAAARRQLQFEAEGLFLSSLLRNPALLDAVQAAYEGATRTVEYDTTDQVEQHTRAYVAPVNWGEEHAALIVFHDQTARINTERMRADFLANASHELRTPLASLTLLIETVAGPARDEPVERARFLSMMQTQAERMRRLIDDLLSLSRIELDEHVPPSDRADLNQVVAEVADALAGVAQERGVSIKVALQSPAVKVVGERFQLAQVVQNLVDNAIKYSKPGGEVVIEAGRAESREEAVQRAGRR